MRPTVVRLLGGVVTLHPFIPLRHQLLWAAPATLIIPSKASLDQLVVELSVCR
jgi:hypothetical protein